VICPHGCPDAVDNYAGHCMTAYLRMKRRTLLPARAVLWRVAGSDNRD